MPPLTTPQPPQRGLLRQSGAVPMVLLRAGLVGGAGALPPVVSPGASAAHPPLSLGAAAASKGAAANATAAAHTPQPQARPVGASASPRRVLDASVVASVAARDATHHAQRMPSTLLLVPKRAHDVVARAARAQPASKRPQTAAAGGGARVGTHARIADVDDDDDDLGVEADADGVPVDVGDGIDDDDDDDDVREDAGSGVGDANDASERPSAGTADVTSADTDVAAETAPAIALRGAPGPPDSAPGTAASPRAVPQMTEEARARKRERERERKRRLRMRKAQGDAAASLLGIEDEETRRVIGQLLENDRQQYARTSTAARVAPCVAPAASSAPPKRSAGGDARVPPSPTAPPSARGAFAPAAAMLRPTQWSAAMLAVGVAAATTWDTPERTASIRDDPRPLNADVSPCAQAVSWRYVPPRDWAHIDKLGGLSLPVANTFQNAGDVIESALLPHVLLVDPLDSGNVDGSERPLEWVRGAQVVMRSADDADAGAAAHSASTGGADTNAHARAASPPSGRAAAPPRTTRHAACQTVHAEDGTTERGLPLTNLHRLGNFRRRRPDQWLEYMTQQRAAEVVAVDLGDGERGHFINGDVRYFNFQMLPSMDVVHIDPPWRLRGAHLQTSGESTMISNSGYHLGYSTLADEEILSLDVGAVSDSGFIFLWVTNSQLGLGMQCMERWGYSYVDRIVWVKMHSETRMMCSQGWYLGHSTETCLIGMKTTPGAPPVEFVPRVWNDVIIAPVSGPSRKPVEIYDLIDAMVPGGRKVDLFARNHNVRPGWLAIGNELGVAFSRLPAPVTCDLCRHRIGRAEARFKFPASHFDADECERRVRHARRTWNGGAPRAQPSGADAEPAGNADESLRAAAEAADVLSEYMSAAGVNQHTCTNLCSACFEKLRVEDKQRALQLKNSASAIVCHQYVSCDSCHVYPLPGVRYTCEVCQRDLCEVCVEAGRLCAGQSGHRLVALEAPHAGGGWAVHRNIMCSACSTCPIVGPRFVCGSCPGLSLCQMCLFAQRPVTGHSYPQHDIYMLTDEVTHPEAARQCEICHVDMTGVFYECGSCFNFVICPTCHERKAPPPAANVAHRSWHEFCAVLPSGERITAEAAARFLHVYREQQQKQQHRQHRAEREREPRASSGEAASAVDVLAGTGSARPAPCVVNDANASASGVGHGDDAASAAAAAATATATATTAAADGNDDNDGGGGGGAGSAGAGNDDEVASNVSSAPVDVESVCSVSRAPRSHANDHRARLVGTMLGAVLGGVSEDDTASCVSLGSAGVTGNGNGTGLGTATGSVVSGAGASGASVVRDDATDDDDDDDGVATVLGADDDEIDCRADVATSDSDGDNVLADDAGADGITDDDNSVVE